MTSAPAQLSVLAIDDSPDVLQLIGEVLGSHYNLKFATDSARAEGLAESEPQPDIVLLDVEMPGRGGYEICRALRGNPRTCHIPVIFLSALSGTADQLKGFASGGVDYLPKPISPTLLRARITVHAALHDQRRALEHSVVQRTAELDRTRMQIIRRLSRAAEFHEGAAATNRVMRVSHYAGVIAKCAGLKPSACELIAKAAPLYDVGKLGVPPQVLNKAESLSDGEWAQLRKHPEIGAAIIGEHADPLLGMARFMALTHHERWDGKGYPKGLEGEHIPFAGRLMAVVDAFESMTTTRYHREKLGIPEAARRIRYQGGRQFDPALVRAFQKALPVLARVRETYADALGELLDLNFTAAS